jgi:phosphoribosyl 1,2-cyclic phosphodiesterase
MDVTILGSSSAGNATLVRGGGVSVLVDAGFSLRGLTQRLEAVGASAATLKGVCISHEHSDHIAGLARLQRRHGTPLYANRGTIEAVSALRGFEGLAWRVFETGADFTIGGLTVHPFSVPHDAYEPVGFVFEADGVRLGIATDLGMPTTLIRERLRACHGLVLEANHDEGMLRRSRRPEHLKARIHGRLGHLSNRVAADLLADLAGPHLQWVCLAHLSEECNDPELCRSEVRALLAERGYPALAIELAGPRAPSVTGRLAPPPVAPAGDLRPAPYDDCAAPPTPPIAED